jgi:hypothetical protein
MPDPELVRYRADGAVATVTLDSPANRNALSGALLTQLVQALDRAGEDPAVRVIVLTGAGPAFCSGADLAEQRTVNETGQATAAGFPLPDVLRRLWRSPKPVLGRVNGPARAGGIGLVAACDVAVASDSATFAFPEVRVGVVDVKTGAQVGSQFNVTTDANGAFVKKVPMDLGEHPALESTVWKKDGSVLVVAAHTRFTAPCKPEDTLAFTGSHTPLLGGLGLVLLAAGGLMVRGSRRKAYHPAH